MEENAFPPVLKNLINSINAEGHLQNWQLQTTLETYSLTLEWIRPASCNGTGDHKFKPLKSDSRAENSAQTSDQTVAYLETDHVHNKETNARGKSEKTEKGCDFRKSCVQSPKADNIVEEGTEFNAFSESAIPEAVMSETKSNMKRKCLIKRNVNPSHRERFKSANLVLTGKLSPIYHRENMEVTLLMYQVK